MKTFYALLCCRSCAKTIVLSFSTTMLGRTPLDSSMNLWQANNVNTFPWPSRSPGLDPIEHGWDMLNRRIRENRHPFNSLEALENALIIPPCKIQKITRGMHYRFVNLSTYNVGSSSRLDQQTTNDGPESFHSNLNAHFYASHPNIFLLQAATYIQIRAIDYSFAPRWCETEKQQFSVAQFECYSKGDKTRSDFIKCLGYKFGAGTVNIYSWKL